MYILLYIYLYIYVVADRYSRQIYTIGNSAQTKLKNSSIILFGIDSLTYQICKCLSLAGCRQLTLVDNRLVNNNNQRSNNLASRLRALSPSCKICTMGEDDVTDLKPFDGIVLVNFGIEKNSKMNIMWRKHKKKCENKVFVSANTLGAIGRIFCDFGDDFEVEEPMGRRLLPPQKLKIDKIIYYGQSGCR
eukprot:GHVL01042920.1.p1 GENE.GHVL01042920.1~~GHVL01042920.1.p1  ORF type:complete len:190 (+),score=48.07 GHVL01042920.1:80-649(+)